MSLSWELFLLLLVALNSFVLAKFCNETLHFLATSYTSSLGDPSLGLHRCDCVT